MTGPGFKLRNWNLIFHKSSSKYRYWFWHVSQRFTTAKKSNKNFETSDRKKKHRKKYKRHFSVYLIFAGWKGAEVLTGVVDVRGRGVVRSPAVGAMSVGHLHVWTLVQRGHNSWIVNRGGLFWLWFRVKASNNHISLRYTWHVNHCYVWPLNEQNQF